MEVRSPEDGQLIELFSLEGDEVNVGKPLFVIDTNATGGSVAATPAPKAAPAPAAAVKAVSTPTPTPVPASSPAAKPTAASAKPATASASPVSNTGSKGDRSETRCAYYLNI